MSYSASTALLFGMVDHAELVTVWVAHDDEVHFPRVGPVAGVLGTQNHALRRSARSPTRPVPMRQQGGPIRITACSCALVGRSAWCGWFVTYSRRCCSRKVLEEGRHVGEGVKDVVGSAAGA